MCLSKRTVRRPTSTGPVGTCIRLEIARLEIARLNSTAGRTVYRVMGDKCGRPLKTKHTPPTPTPHCYYYCYFLYFLLPLRLRLPALLVEHAVLTITIIKPSQSSNHHNHQTITTEFEQSSPVQSSPVHVWDLRVACRPCVFVCCPCTNIRVACCPRVGPRASEQLLTLYPIRPLHPIPHNDLDDVPVILSLSVCVCVCGGSLTRPLTGPLTRTRSETERDRETERETERDPSAVQSLWSPSEPLWTLYGPPMDPPLDPAINRTQFDDPPHTYRTHTPHHTHTEHTPHTHTAHTQTECYNSNMQF
jgi:hypothetical protein